MKTRTRVTIVILIALASLLVGFRAHETSWTCHTGHSCHALMEPNSNTYILTVEEDCDVVQNGPRSWEIVCR